MRKVFMGLVLGAVVSSAPVLAEDRPQTVDSLFGDFFRSENYERSAAGRNIMGFLRKLQRANVSVAGGFIVEITNEGFSNFGLVEARNARQEGPRSPQWTREKPDFLPGDTNWGFHAFLEYDGKIWDFDYLNEPTPIKVKPYVEKMFLDGISAAEKKDKLDDYKIVKVKVEDFYANTRDPRTETMNLRAYQDSAR